MDTLKPIIELQHVSVCYDRGKSNELIALKDVSLQIFEGEYIVFLGPSGCGKSTLLYTIAGLESATDGKVMVGEKNLREIKPRDLIEFYRSTIGMVFQAFYLVAQLSAKDNIILPKMFSGVSKLEREKHADELIDKFGITTYANRKPSMMSGGQQQRTAIARALMNNPKIILADEPVGNLDSKNAEIVLELLADIHRVEKKTIIQVTHNARDAHYADRVFYMKDGAIERIVANTETGKANTASAATSASPKEMTELEKLTLANPNFSEMRLRAKLITRRLLLAYDFDTEEKIEISIERYLKGELSKEALAAFMDDSNGGAGLYSQKARHIADSVEDIVQEIAALKTANEVPNPADTPLHAQMLIVRNHLLDEYAGTLSHEEIHTLESIIKSRIAGEIGDTECRELLDKPKHSGGLGLNKRTARKFSEEIEFVLSSAKL